MRRLQSLVTRREKNRERKSRWRSSKRSLCVERLKDEGIRGEWHGRFVFTITYQNLVTKEFHALDFYLSDKRVNSYRVCVDGKPWKKQISASRALAALRKKLPRFRVI